MYRRELMLLATVVFGAFAIAFAGAWLVTARLQREVIWLTADSLPALVNSGALRARVEENWGLLQSALQAQTHEARTNLIAQIAANSVDTFLVEFEATAKDARERQMLRTIRESRGEFLAKRTRLFGLVEEQRLPEATRYFESDVTASYRHYQAAAKEMFHYEMAEGTQRAAKVSRLAHIMPWLAGGLGLAIFLAGIVFGLKAALGGLGMVSRLASVATRDQRT
jgi:hypothetical protein